MCTPETDAQLKGIVAAAPRNAESLYSLRTVLRMAGVGVRLRTVLRMAGVSVSLRTVLRWAGVCVGLAPFLLSPL